MRLLLPGWEGNMNVKWLRQLKLTAEPQHTKDETSKYSDLMHDGKSQQFTFVLGVKSTITHPSFGMTMQGPGSTRFPASRGRARAASRASKFRPTAARRGKKRGCRVRCSRRASPAFGCRGSGTAQPALLQSRAIDEKGNVQPSRKAWNAAVLARQSLSPQRDPDLERATPTGASRMFIFERSLSALVPAVLARGLRDRRHGALRTARQRPRTRSTGDRRRNRAARYQHPAERRGTASRAAATRARAPKSMSPNARRATARKAPGKPADALVGGMGTLRVAVAGADGRQLLAVRDDACSTTRGARCRRPRRARSPTTKSTP